MKRWGSLLVCALLFLGSRIPANAQSNTELTNNWNLRAGFFVPERASARSAQGDIWFTIGAEHAFYQTDRYTATISVDYYGAGNLYNIPISMNLRGETNRLRYGAGAGLGVSHDFVQGITGFAYNVLVGYTLRSGPNPVVFDVRYMGQSSGGGVLNGWAMTLGYQF